MVFLAAGLLLGCRSEPALSLSASGTVTADGRPLSGAVITFEPVSPTTGPNASVPVFDGKFVIPAEAELHGGTYRVRVAMIPAELRQNIPAEQAGSMPPDDAVIDPAFDADSTLTCELVADQANTLSFAVDFL